MEKTKNRIDLKSVIRVQEYLKKGLNQSEIARIMKTTRQQVNRWVFYIEKGIVDSKDTTVDKD